MSIRLAKSQLEWHLSISQKVGHSNLPKRVDRHGIPRICPIQVKRRVCLARTAKHLRADVDDEGLNHRVADL